MNWCNINEREFGEKTHLYYALLNDRDHLSKYLVATTTVNNENPIIFAVAS